MNFITDFREEKLIKYLARKIADLSQRTGVKRIMEVCGGHTHVIIKYGLHQILSRNIDFIHGPGCPVCIIPKERVDHAVALAGIDDVILVTFGDMMRVPGSKSSLVKERAAAKNVRMVYSPLDVIKIARENRDKKVVYFAIGFETTTPMAAMLMDRVFREGIKNVLVHVNHVLIPPAMEAIMNSEDVRIDPFIAPGHVTTVTGSSIYEFIPEKYSKPVVISGFEPADILESISMILKQFAESRSEVEIQYTRSVRREGNVRALEIMDRYFEARESFRWRGLGDIPRSGLKLKSQYSGWDAEVLFDGLLPDESIDDHWACICGEILRGKARPYDCASFGKACTPENPLGACMVSSEGACQAYYRYQPGKGAV